MKIRLVLIICLLSLKGFSQTGPTIESSLPKVSPPSPTVAALMKFEEVPVDNYAGIPDISIPLYNIQTHSKDVAINLSLKYHPSSIAVLEDAGYTGLGWSLLGGGTISRTVRGLPDDFHMQAGNGRMGVYGTNSPYYDAFNSMGTDMSTEQKKTFNKFLWDVAERGTYDSEHDLYQFSFMGYNGRFYIKKTGDSYEVVKLDNDNSVSINYDSTVKTFTLYDDKGNSYLFDVKEETTQTTGYYNSYFNGSVLSNLNAGFDYTSAFHLSKVYDSNGKLLIEIEYNNDATEPMIENSRDGSMTQATITSPLGIVNQIETLGAAASEIQKLDPQESRDVTLRITHTRKMKQVRIQGKAKIDFILTNDRTDTDNEGTYRLRQIKVHNWTDTITIKKFRLKYDNLRMNLYNLDGDPRSRMILTKVIESDAVGNYPQTYELEYNIPPFESTVYGTDYWGFANSKEACAPELLLLSANPATCKVGVLQKMRMPSGGAVVFNWESNTYSYNGDQPLDNFDENPDNWDYNTHGYTFSSSGETSHNIFFLGSQTIYANFTPTSTTADGQPGAFWLYKLGPNGEVVDTIGINCGNNNGGCTTLTIPLTPGPYRIQFFWLNSEIPGSGTVDACFRYRNSNNLEFLYGGGIRIKNIGYFENGTVSAKYYDGAIYQDGYTPAKQKNFDYRAFDNVSRSSGSLVYPRPVYDYSDINTCEIQYSTSQGMIIRQTYDITYRKHTSFNRLNPAKTHGSDVGYKNVAVSETGNGKSRYTYTSAQDYPEVNNGIASAAMPSPNYDYKRGLLQKEQHYNEAVKILSETCYKYDIIEGEEKTGLHIAINEPCPYMYSYGSSDAYYDTALNCTAAGGGTIGCDRQCGLPSEYIAYAKITEAFGWIKAIRKETKEYFYDSANVLQGTVITKDTLEYNTSNKKIKWQETETYSVAGSVEKMRTDYTYKIWPNSNNVSSIDDIKTSKNGTLIDTKKILYGTLAACSLSPTLPSAPRPSTVYLPVAVQTAKGDKPLENKVEFLRYDSYSNPLEVKQTDGMTISYIWGYNKTQPIAMIENASYEQIATALGIDACALENYNESNLEQIDDLRDSMSNVMVSTYTYTPLVGVTSIKDPKGYLTTYHYDAMGRLEFVKDQAGNLLSENKYHYRTP